MPKTTRWMTWVLDEAAKTDVAMPFERGERGLDEPVEKFRKAG